MTQKGTQVLVTAGVYQNERGKVLGTSGATFLLVELDRSGVALLVLREEVRFVRGERR